MRRSARPNLPKHLHEVQGLWRRPYVRGRHGAAAGPAGAPAGELVTAGAAPVLHIDPEFQALCPPLDEEERQLLTDSVLAEGCRESLVCWRSGGQPWLIDGHNRYALCQQHGIPFTTRYLALRDRAAVVDWIIANQLGRRNLSPEQKSYLRGKRYLAEKQRVGAPVANTNAAKQCAENEHIDSRTSERLAAEYGVAPSTIRADAEYAEAVDTIAEVEEALRQEVLKRRTPKDAKRPTKARVIALAKQVIAQATKPLPCMKRGGWKPYQVLEGLELLANAPAPRATGD